MPTAPRLYNTQICDNCLSSGDGKHLHSKCAVPWCPCICWDIKEIHPNGRGAHTRGFCPVAARKFKVTELIAEDLEILREQLKEVPLPWKRRDMLNRRVRWLLRLERSLRDLPEPVMISSEIWSCMTTSGTVSTGITDLLISSGLYQKTVRSRLKLASLS